MGKVLSFIYEGMADYEVMFAVNRLKKLGGKEILTIAYEKTPIKSQSGYTYLPNITIDEALNFSDVEALIITGGPLQEQKNSLTELIQKIHDQGKLVAAICFAPQFLARAGILRHHKYTTSCTAPKIAAAGFPDPFPRQNEVETRVMVDGNLITAKGYAFIDFTAEVLDWMNVFDDQNAKSQFLHEARGI